MSEQCFPASFGYYVFHRSLFHLLKQLADIHRLLIYSKEYKHSVAFDLDLFIKLAINLLDTCASFHLFSFFSDLVLYFTYYLKWQNKICHIYRSELSY